MRDAIERNTVSDDENAQRLLLDFHHALCTHDGCARSLPMRNDLFDLERAEVMTAFLSSRPMELNRRPSTECEDMPRALGSRCWRGNYSTGGWHDSACRFG